MIRVLLVDDYEPWHRFFLTALQKRPDLQVIAQASDGLDAVQQAQELQPDLILLDIGLPTLNGIEAARRIREVSPHSKILFISENRSPDIAEQALNTGAGGYVVKSNVASELLPAVKAVFQGKRFVSASFAGHDIVTSDRGVSGAVHISEYNPYLRLAESPLIPDFLTSVIDTTAADFGTLQLFDSIAHVLRIVANHGFESEFLTFFGTVGCDDHSPCSSAMNGRCRIVVADVATDPLFSNDSRGVMLRSNVRSVQSTPLIEGSGNFIGMVSTHYDRPQRPMLHMWKRVDDLVASFLAEINT